MTVALGLILFGLLFVYAGVKGKSVSSLLLGNNQTDSTVPTTVDRTGGGTGTASPIPPPAPNKTGKSSGKSGGLVEAFYDPLGSYDNGKFGGPIGGHTDHVHLSITNPQIMLQAISIAQQMGLNVGENPYVGTVHSVHVDGSYHYKDFPGLYNGRKLGMAIDVSGAASQMASFYRLITLQFAH
jgi:hypothetical protein